MSFNHLNLLASSGMSSKSSLAWRLECRTKISHDIRYFLSFLLGGMLWSALSLFVKNEGDEKASSERHLKNALKHMKGGGQLHPSLWQRADHLNQLGNVGAHSENYDDVTIEEAQALSSFVRQHVTIEYEIPAHLERAQDAALKAQEGATSE